MRDKHLALMGLLMGLLLIRPMIPTFVTNVIFLSVTIASAVLVAENKRRTRIILGILGLPLVIWATVDKVVPDHVISIAHGMVGSVLAFSVVAFLSYSGGVILISLVRSTRISSDVIFGTVNFYLILGFIWAYIFVLVEILSPNSFNVHVSEEALAQGAVRDDLLVSKLIYFSFVTMTTLGYGDITPRSELAETLVVVEAIMGQLYVAVAIAYLLSMHIMQFRQELTEDKETRSESCPERVGERNHRT